MMDHQVWSEKKRAGKMGENGGKKEQEASLRLKNRLSMSERLKHLEQQAIAVNFQHRRRHFFNVEFSSTSLTRLPEPQIPRQGERQDIRYSAFMTTGLISGDHI